MFYWESEHNILRENKISLHFIILFTHPDNNVGIADKQRNKHEWIQIDG